MIIFLGYVILIFVLIKDFFRKPRTYPPGPRQYPVVGNLISVWYNLRKHRCHHNLWQEWSNKYGNILGLRLGSVNVVVVSGHELIKEVSMRDVFAGRPDGLFYMIRSFGKKLGLVFSEGQTWIKTHRVVMKQMKNFGYGSRSMEALIVEECKDLLQVLMRNSGTPVKINEIFDISIMNILWRLIAGKRYNLDDKQLLKICNLINQVFKSVDISGGVLNFMPYLRHVAPNLTGYTRNKQLHDEIYDFLRGIVKQHKESIDVLNPRDVIDAFLIEILNGKNQTLSDEDLLVVCLDLLEAGVETTSRTIDFLILHVVNNKHVQAKLHQEIDEIIGQARAPTLSDRSRMVYTEAVLMEILRISSVAPVGIPHMALDDAKLGRYIIPKGTCILLSMFDLHNGSHWCDPRVFKPERFITKHGNLIQDEWLMPFGTGRRKCIGEGLARSELFLLLTFILQKFHISLPSGDPIPNTDPVDGVSLSAKPFRVVFVPRDLKKTAEERIS